MSKCESIKEFNLYIKKLVEGLHLENEEKRELEEEWNQHLLDHYRSLIRQNVEREEAIFTAIEQFGDINLLQDEVNHAYPSSRKQLVYKEIVIASLCLIASIIGPMILIGAHFRLYLILAPIQAFIFAYVINRYIISRLTNTLLSVVGFIIVYICIFQFKMLDFPFTFEWYISELFSLDLDRLTGPFGLFHYVTIHMLWYLVVIIQLLSSKNYIPTWKRVCNASFQYWAMLLFGLFLARFQSSGEWSILYVNVFLIYSFCQKVISIEAYQVFKNKVYHLIKP